MTLQVSVSGIRGIVGESLDATVVSRWAAAFGAWLPAGPVVVGRDSRPTGPMVRDAVVAALASTGHDVRDIGIATTGDGNVVAMGRAVQKRLDEFSDRIPVGMELGVVALQSETVTRAVGGFVSNLLQAVGIVLAVLCLTMGLAGGLQDPW